MRRFFFLLPNFFFFQNLLFGKKNFFFSFPRFTPRFISYTVFGEALLMCQAGECIHCCGPPLARSLFNYAESKGVSMVQKISSLKLMNVANVERGESRLPSILIIRKTEKKSKIHKRLNSNTLYKAPHTCTLRPPRCDDVVFIRPRFCQVVTFNNYSDLNCQSPLCRLRH